MVIDDNFFMSLAISEAWHYQGLTYPNPAVGATVVKNGKILSIEAHRRAGSSHAELKALVSAYEVLSSHLVGFDKDDASLAYEFILSLPSDFFKGCSIYITLEPCIHKGKTPSCAYLLSRFEFKRVIVATLDPIPSHAGGAKMLLNSGLDVTVGVLEDEANTLIEPFKIWQKRAFVLFKIAQSANGRIGGGYLSSKASLTHTHKLREVANELVIGGSTVRSDRPKLDCRFISKRAPNVTIYSKKREFDNSIPLFSVPNRRVDITDNLEPLLKKRGFLLVEGGEGMLRALDNKIDWFLIYQTPKLSLNPLSYNIDKKLEYLHTQKLDVDIMIWSRFG